MNTENKLPNVRVRFAPSPTGNIHIGNARVAVLNWLFARRHDGMFMLRFDDTDKTRSSDNFAKSIEKDLSWLGVSYQEKIKQSERLHLYNQATETLKKQGRLYPCFDTPEELTIQRKTQNSQGLPPVYDNRKSLSRSADDIAELIKKGLVPHWRFRLNKSPVSWYDMVRGEVRFESLNMSDPVLIREDGCPLYTFTSVVDDIDTRISHVIRGEDHVANTATQFQLFEALNATPPSFAHIPLLLDSDGKPLSKRIGSLSLEKMRENSLFPRTILLYLARLGTNHAPSASETINQIISSFDLANFGRATPCFNEKIISSLNQTILQNMPFDEAKHFLPDDASLDFWETIRHNVLSAQDISIWWEILSSDTLKNPYSPQDQEELEYLKLALKLLPSSNWNDDKESINNVWNVWQQELKNKTDKKGKNLMLPLRLMLTGLNKGPDIPSILLYLGYDRTQKRLLSTIDSKN